TKLGQIYDDELAKIAKSGVDAQELTKAINQIRIERISSLESVQSLAESVQDANFYFGYPQAVFGELDSFRKVTPQDIQRVAAKYPPPDRRLSINVVPAKSPATPAVEPTTAATAEATEAAKQYAYVLDQKTPPPPLDAGKITLPTFSERTLSNGMQLVVATRP